MTDRPGFARTSPPDAGSGFAVFAAVRQKMCLFCTKSMGIRKKALLFLDLLFGLIYGILYGIKECKKTAKPLKEAAY